MNRIARIAVAFATAATLSLSAQAAYADYDGEPSHNDTPNHSSTKDDSDNEGHWEDKGSPKSDSQSSSKKNTEQNSKNTKDDKGPSNKDDYDYEQPGEDGSYKLDKKQCLEALSHPEPPHQDGERWAYWHACRDKYGDHKAPVEHKTTTKYHTAAPSVAISPNFTG